MHAFVVAVEYEGDTVTVCGGAPRRPLCEHAYDLETAQLAGHPPGQCPRVAFPTRQRGWNTGCQIARCPACDIAVNAILRAIVSRALSRINTRSER
jgi:hypothetical protein